MAGKDQESKREEIISNTEIGSFLCPLFGTY